MQSPKVSVIIPTFKGAEFLGEAIQSVLEQTYPHFELIVINDSSPDNTTEVVKRFDDPRIKYIVHNENKGVGQARYTGLQASTGEIISLLDQDDFFHPQKLQAHVAFLENHPDFGFTYNARFELNYSAKTIRDLWRPPENISLTDLVLWFPIGPSDAVMRRKWAFDIEWLGQRRGAEIDQFGGLYLAGCKFGYINRALNYRRHHSERFIADIRQACESEISNQVQIITDPRFPSELLGIGNAAHANLYIYWAYRAFIQNETALGQEYTRNAVRLKPSVAEGNPSEIMKQFLINCIDDENLNHEHILQDILLQLPEDLNSLSRQVKWAIEEGYLLKGARSIIWGRLEDGDRYFKKALELEARVDDYYLSTLAYKLLDYEAEFGYDATKQVFRGLSVHLKKLPGGTNVHTLMGKYWVNRALQYYHAGEYFKAQTMAMRAIGYDPKYLANRGVLAVIGHSLLKPLYKGLAR